MLITKVESPACKNLKQIVLTLDALVVEDDLVVVCLDTFEGGTFSATSNAGKRGVPGGVRSLRNTFTCYVQSNKISNNTSIHVCTSKIRMFHPV